jgi:hypothetical protein
MKTLLPAILILLACTHCTSLKNLHKYEMSDGVYSFRQTGSTYQTVQVHIKEDSIYIISKHKNEPIVPLPTEHQIFLRGGVDIDIMTIPFKYRPAKPTLPRQLTTDFNGCGFIGFRYDRFTKHITQTPIGLVKANHHRAITMGAFGGIGATAITPWTTGNKITDEYSGLVLSRGIAAMVGVNNLTVGLGVGWDYLTDRDKHLWIYQNKPWYGLTVGLNIN